MSYLFQNREKSPANHYIFSIVITLSAYLLIGQIPLFIAYAFAEHQTLDLIQTLQDNYGLNVTFILIMIPLVAAFLGLFLSIKLLHKWKFRSVFTGRSKIDFKRIIVSFFLWMLISMGIFLYGFNDKVVWNLNWSAFIPLFFLGCIIVPIQCAAEEVFFRGYLPQWLGEKINKVWVIVFISGTLFGLLHAANPEVSKLGNSALIYYIWSGFFLGILAVYDDGLELPLGYHIANNLFATLIVTTDWQAFRTDALFIDTNPPSFTVEMMTLLIMGQAVFMLSVHLIFNKKNVKLV